MGPLLVALAGLPGTGKSTLAAALSAATGWPVFDKDAVRAALFGPARIECSRDQDDLCARLTYEAATWVLATGRSAGAILDGRTYARKGSLEPLLALRAALPGLRLALVECTCPSAVAEARLARDAADGGHPAPDRDPRLHRALAAQAVPLAPPADVLHLRVDTGAGTGPGHVARLLACLAGGSDPPAPGSVAREPGGP